MLVAEALGQYDLKLCSAEGEAGSGLAAPDGPALAELSDSHAATETLCERGGRRSQVLPLEALLDLPQVLMAERLKPRLQLLEREDDHPPAGLATARQGDALPPLGCVHVSPPEDMSRRASDRSPR